MPPQIALALWFVLLLALFWFDRTSTRKASPALWIPVLWVAIIGSRLPSQWIGIRGDAAEAMNEGNGFDRVVYTGLIALALAILSRRSFAWSQFVAKNLALTLILVYSLISCTWSDFGFVAFKRLFRDVGLYLAIVVALTDSSGLGGARVLLRWVCFLLMPLSVLLIKYFEMGRTYDHWTGQVYFIGATTSKNMLGVLCLVGGLFFIWDTLTRLKDRTDPGRRRAVLVNLVFIGMTLWLLSMAGSATSSVCLAIGASTLFAAQTKIVRRRPALLTVAIPFAMTFYVVLEFAFGINIMDAVAVAAGRDPDLTGRTNIWEVVLAMGTNPLLGAGYESFWLGPRLEWIWERAGGVNEAHNGFLEVYLTLGFIGLALYVLFLFGSYWKIARLMKSSSFASLSLSLWTVLIFYNVTESALRGHLLWIAFLLGAIAVPLSGAVVASENAANPAEDTRDQRRDDLRRDARGFPSRKNGERPSLSPAAWRLARSRGHEREFLFERASVAGCARARADAPQ